MSFFTSSLFAKAKQHFRHQTRFSTYGRSIHALAISNNGQALACGGNLTCTLLCEGANRRAGTEGIKLWDIKSRKELTCSTHHHESRGTISCAVWITTRQGMAATLCYGTGLGYIMQFQETCARRLGSGFELTCMVWDSTSSEGNTRIAVGTRDKIIQVLVLNPNSQLQAVFSVRLDNTVPKLYDGNFIKLRGDDGAVLKEYSCQSVIHMAVNQKRGVFVVDNATNSFTLYRLEVASASPALGCRKATINLWLYDYGIVKGTLTSEQSWSTSRVIAYVFKILVHFGALVVIICFLMTNYFDTVATWSGDLAQHMTTTRVFTFLDKNFHSAEVFNKVPEAHQEVVEQNNMLMLHELAGKLIQVVQEAMKDGDIDHLTGEMTWSRQHNPPDNRMSVEIAEDQKESPGGRNGKGWAKECPKIRKNCLTGGMGTERHSALQLVGGVGNGRKHATAKIERTQQQYRPLQDRENTESNSCAQPITPEQAPSIRRTEVVT
ncbi:hypothetical protein C8R48DRAFT_673560 [Suillus tomentosus]|nr:hypothetical protein C8R48DRAFT_673560 [Suillus tomentosus]